MKKAILTVILALAAFALFGCEDDEKVLIVDEIPAAPQGVFSVTGNSAVFVYWNGPYEGDITEYWIYRSLDSNTGYTVIGTVTANLNPNLDLIIYEFVDSAGANPPLNGQTYFYAVASVDQAGQLSELSAETVFDTPRPEGTAIIFDTAFVPSESGYDLSAQSNVSWDAPTADIFVDQVGGVFYINAADTLTDLQDMGYTAGFDDIDFAPRDGWSENGWVEIIVGHTYVVWTRNLHFAKMRVQSISSTFVSFRWAYQTDQDNPELVPARDLVQKPIHTSEYLKKNKEGFGPFNNEK